MPQKEQVVLVADDDSPNRDSLTAALQDLDLRTDVACSGREALDMIEQREYALLLLESTLADTNGIEVLRRLRHIHPHLPVVFVAPRATAETVVDALRHGAFDFLEQPLSRLHVQDVVQKALGRREAKDDPSKEYNKLLRLAHHCIDEGDFDDAMEHVKTAVALAPGRAEAFNMFGAIHEKRGDRQSAVKFYRAACALDFFYKPAEHNLNRLTIAPWTGSNEICFEAER